MDRHLSSSGSTLAASPFSGQDLIEEITRLKREMNAIILAHYYQESEIQDVADFIGDSLELSRKAAATDADYIVFCGVRFMADVAKILSPTKTVLLPDLNAGCSLEESCPPDAFKAFIQHHPDHLVLTYINSSIEVKALSDIIVTSSSAERIIRQLPEHQKIIFAPDKYLGDYLIRKTGRDMVLWDGACIVHERFSEKSLIQLHSLHPEAKIIAHPECPPDLLAHADFIGSTSALLNITQQDPASAFIVLTEPGILHPMRLASPEKTFYEVPGLMQGSCSACNSCPYMRLNTLEKLYTCMTHKTPEIQIDETLRLQAKRSLDRLLDMTK